MKSSPIFDVQLKPQAKTEAIPHIQGLLLVQLGTPDTPRTSDVRNYLKEFLMDPEVVDIPYLFRWLLVHGLILPRRAQQSARLYQKIWTKDGSPLRIHLSALNQKLQEELGSQWHVESAMRYGNPSLLKALKGFEASGVRHVTVLPLYPQYSTAATRSSLKECLRQCHLHAPSLKLTSLPPFYKNPHWLDAVAQTTQTSLQGISYDHVLISFHGLPERQIQKADVTQSHCLFSAQCCEQDSPAHAHCYRAQCYATALGIAQRMNWSAQRYTVCFQSRLGRTPWIRPYTDLLYQDLPKKGVRRLAVLCPSFVADCLETLEEVAIRGKKDFLAQGGVEFHFVPCVNANPHWIEGLGNLVRESEGMRDLTESVLG